MNLNLFTESEFPSSDLVRLFKAEEIRVEVCPLHPLPVKRTVSGQFTAIVIREPAITVLARPFIESSTSFILCSPPVTTPADRKLLRDQGVTNLISPLSWSPTDVFERILAELFLLGAVQPFEFGRLRGATQKMQRLYRDIATLAPFEDTVLILGETGSGKELIAQELHRLSGRPGEILALNCAELRPELMGSELFGHAAGAFTDARQDRKGLFAEAGENTVFLDEIGDLDRTAQAQLLRVLEERKFRPVGANKWVEFRGRIVLATHRNLEAACEEGKFRYDLLQRIKGFTLEPPPLRERRADIPLLARYFVEECKTSRGYRKDLTISSASFDALFGYDWPGNVRELRAVVRKAAAYPDGVGTINATVFQDLARPKAIQPVKNSISFDPASESLREVLSRAQTQYLRAILTLTGNNKEEAVKRSGLSRTQFYEKLKELGKSEAEVD